MMIHQFIKLQNRVNPFIRLFHSPSGGSSFIRPVQPLISKNTSYPGSERINPTIFSSQALAFVGDSVWDLALRERSVYSFQQHQRNQSKGKDLHLTNVFYSRAETQNYIVKHLQESCLTNIELDLIQQGQSASAKGPRRLAKSIYHNASGFEILLGYLYYGKDQTRLNELLKYCFEDISFSDLHFLDRNSSNSNNSNNNNSNNNNNNNNFSKIPTNTTPTSKQSTPIHSIDSFQALLLKDNYPGRTHIDPTTMSVKALAFVGDSVWEQALRERCIYPTIKWQSVPRNKRTEEATFFACAETQNYIVKCLHNDESLSFTCTDIELELIKKGKSASGKYPKNVIQNVYHNATGLEILLGFLYFGKKATRLNELLTFCFKVMSDMKVMEMKEFKKSLKRSTRTQKV